MEQKIIELPCYGIVVKIVSGKFGLLAGSTIESKLRDDCPFCGNPNCYHECDKSQAEGHGGSQETEEHVATRRAYNTAVGGIETLIFALAIAGVDINTTAVIEAIVNAVEAADKVYS